jgi:hypothetical protein
MRGRRKETGDINSQILVLYLVAALLFLSSFLVTIWRFGAGELEKVRDDGPAYRRRFGVSWTRLRHP